MSVWPEKFVILRNNFKIELGDRTLSSNMDVGPAKKRRRTMLITSVVTFSMYLTQDVFDEFVEFYYANDVSVFDFTRPDNKQLKKARFSAVPTCSYNETAWVVSVQLELLP